MNGLTYIQSRQQNWAKTKRFTLIGGTIPDRGEKNYLQNIKDNLFDQQLSKESQNDYNLGDGSETKDTKTRLAKMKALHSSSAIVVNIFQYWQNKDVYPIVYACKMCAKYPPDIDIMIENIGSNQQKVFSISKTNSINKIRFEQKFRVSNDTSLFRHAPNLDIIIDGFQPQIYAIESKFTEPYSSRENKGISKKYIDGDFWFGLSNLHELALKICPDNNEFHYLDASQLIKHILGLKTNHNKNGFRLLYLWYDVIGRDGTNHRNEIERFAEIAEKDNIKFSHITYQEVIMKLSKEFYIGNEDYCDYLTNRYL